MRPGNQFDRRAALKLGGISALGLGIPHFLSLRAAQAAGRPAGSMPAASAKSCILIWLDGGPSHLETFDPKPDATVEVRGPLGTIATPLAGVRLNECLAETAKRMADLAIIRSMTSPLGEHNFGTHYLQTGYRPSPVLNYPSFQTVLSNQRGEAGELPSQVALPDARMGGRNFVPNGFLPPAAGPFSLEADPARPGFQVRDLAMSGGLNLKRLDRRREFVEQLDRFSGIDNGPAEGTLEQAFRLVTSAKAREAFDLAQEKDNVRQRYGRKTVGQCCLLARRLVERGVPFVTVNSRGWDTHADLTTRLKDGFAGAARPVGLVPSLDQALSALLDDLKQRGMLDETLVIVMGEFGRTPKLNAAGGRDHWPRVFSVALAGGGVRGGQVIGKSDRNGESPLDRPVTPGDLVATIYQLLGIHPGLELQTPTGRPVRITPVESAVISELLTG